MSETQGLQRGPAAIESGLSRQEAAKRLQQEGYNELPQRRKRTVLSTAASLAREPMFVLLLAAGTIYLLVGDLSDALLLLGFVVVSMAITVLQERKTERVLENLKHLSSPRALVIREGELVRIPGREVVPGDLLVLEEGDRVAADGHLIESHGLLIDESLLTGESTAVEKAVPARAPREDSSLQQVYSGSLVVRGGGLAEVSATGARTELGKIGKSLQTVTPEQSPLQKEIRRLTKRFALFGAAISVLVFFLYTGLRGDWLNGLLTGTALAMSLLPEEFTVIFTVFMALGAWRIAKKQVLTRHTPVIEALGAATVLCVDKTGTLTQNQMSVRAVIVDRDCFATDAMHRKPVPDGVREVLKHAVLASEVLPFDPMEKALHRALESIVPGFNAGLGHAVLMHDYPLTSDLLAMTHAWRFPGEPVYTVATKGAPESVGRLCKLDAAQRADMLEQAERLATQGMRVMAVAKARYHGDDWPQRPDGFSFNWLGLIGLADPLRAEVPGAIAECQEAGIRVVMITGDYPVTAQAIAREAGLPSDSVVTGAQLDAASEAAIRAIVHNTHVFARVRPHHKLRLVTAFKAEGHVVAMTGDGVNDAPALKAAHIGISMGERGTDVAREASSLVLLNDDFTSIVHAIRLGRRIYDNLRKALTYVVAVHLPIAGMVMFPLFFATPSAFAPVHIAFLEMIINPACALIYEPEAADRDLMKTPPRPAAERLFGAKNVAFAVLLGFGSFVAVAAVFYYGLAAGLNEGQARVLGFTGIVLGNLSLIVSTRSMYLGLPALIRIPNHTQWWILGGAVIALAAVLDVPALQAIFHFSPVQPEYLLAVALTCMATLVWFEAIKRAFWIRLRHSAMRIGNT